MSPSVAPNVIVASFALTDSRSQVQGRVSRGLRQVRTVGARVTLNHLTWGLLETSAYSL